MYDLTSRCQDLVYMCPKYVNVLYKTLTALFIIAPPQKFINGRMDKL